MSDFRLPDAAHIGAAHLRVSDLERAIVFYRDLLGLLVIEEEGPTAALSSTGAAPAILQLTELPGARYKPPRTTGLYHVAIRVPDRPALGQVFHRLVHSEWPLEGAADHLVSEALYLADPDGNGLELYADRPRSAWAWEGDAVAMASNPLDSRGLLALAHTPWTGLAAGTDIGHVHLHVSDLARAEEFYCGVLGFDVTQRSYPGALFVAAGGYHHHIGLNIWAGQGAPPAPPDAAGLISFTVAIPDHGAWQTAIDRARTAGAIAADSVATDEDAAVGILLRDPDGIGVVLAVET